MSIYNVRMDDSPRVSFSRENIRENQGVDGREIKTLGFRGMRLKKVKALKPPVAVGDCFIM